MPKRPDDRVRLLHGPYHAPRLHVGDCATCLFRDCDVIVTGWTDAPISWPRCKRTKGKGYPSLLVNEELARAVRLESAAAVMHWWGVGVGVVWRWRKALGVNRVDNPGTRRLMLAAAEKGGEGTRAVEWTPEMREQRSRRAIDQNLGRNLKPGYNLGPCWTTEEIALLGTLPDDEVVRWTGRTAEAVRSKRESLGVPNPTARPGAYSSAPWTEEDDTVLRQLPPREAARRLGRTIDAVYGRRSLLGLPAARRGKPSSGS